jgi:L-glutamine-phosphate cytidylyltransferase
MEHKISRYLFELLSFIEDQDKFLFEKRDVADSLCMSCDCISEAYQSLLEQGCIEEIDGYTVITNTGLSALEPYRVNRAVILAAGFGSRMMPATAERPKPMVTVNGRHIIETLLDALVAADIKDITIVRGYHKEKFDELLEKYPFLHFIDNDEYGKTNNISSAILARDCFYGGAYLCESDLYITNPVVIRKYQYVSNILGSYSLQTDDWSFKMDDNGHIKDYQKGNTFCWNYYGISYWTAEDCEKLNHDWEETFKIDKDVFWEQVPLQLKKEDYAVEIRPCSKQDIIEIDNYGELAMLDPSYR